jgi:1-acyl-sn-glycerol-3-phosphate acyltransferase
VLKFFAQKVLRACGWKIVGRFPSGIKKCVIIAAPHTSNWDLLWMLLAAIVLEIRPNWFGKYTLFKPPLGFLLRALGGIPIDRRSSNNAVEAGIATFQQTDTICLAVPPEGTRRRVDYWKTGFYHIAHGAGVPIVCSFLDYGTRTAGLGPIIQPSGDIYADMKIFQEFYAQMSGRHADFFGPVRVRPGAGKDREETR